ncbi:MAG: HD domain-containing protein [Deltaproteobacteria bacterium]|nr:HD domain-containing protein [Deltaproteobacteria bacterium]
MIDTQAYPFEVRCPMHGSIPFNETERRIIDHPFLQRLRAISQLGFASLVYPGATHTRFSHSLGVMHLAGRVFDEIVQRTPSLAHGPFSPEALDYFRRIVRLAGLLHDVGHPPFSHSFERLLPPRVALTLPLEWYRKPLPPGQATHEDFSVAVVYALAREKPQVLTLEEARDVCALIELGIAPTSRLDGNGRPECNIYPLLKQIISGEIDADRMDYLRRDSHFAGVTYGMFDMTRIVQSLTARLHPQGWSMVLDQNAVYTYENFLIARFHMAMQVYLHKTVIPFEHYLSRAVEEQEIACPLDGSLENFLEAREDQIQSLWYSARDRPWCSRLFYRRPLTRLMQLDQSPEAGLRDEALRALGRAGIETIHIRTERRLSTLGLGGNGGLPPISVLRMLLGREILTPLQEASSLLEHYNQVFTIENLYCAQEDAPAARKVLQKLLD